MSQFTERFLVALNSNVTAELTIPMFSFFQENSQEIFAECLLHARPSAKTLGIKIKRTDQVSALQVTV